MHDYNTTGKGIMPKGRGRAKKEKEERKEGGRKKRRKRRKPKEKRNLQDLEQAVVGSLH